MQKWEYISFDLKMDFGKLKIKDSILEGYGTNGWELVTIFDGIAYFKRPITTDVFIVNRETGKKTPWYADESP